MADIWRFPGTPNLRGKKKIAESHERVLAVRGGGDPCSAKEDVKRDGKSVWSVIWQLYGGTHIYVFERRIANQVAIS